MPKVLYSFIDLGNTLKHVDRYKENTRTGQKGEIPLAFIGFYYCVHKFLIY